MSDINELFKPWRFTTDFTFLISSAFLEHRIRILLWLNVIVRNYPPTPWKKDTDIIS